MARRVPFTGRASGVASVAGVGSAAVGLAILAAITAFECPWEPDRADSRALWHVAGAGWSQPAFDSASAFFPTTHHEVVAIDKRTGQVRWRVRLPYVATCFGADSFTVGFAATMAGGSVVTMDDGLFALDAVSGASRWMFHPPEGCMAGTSRAGSDGQTVYAGASRGSVYAVDGATGTVEWRGRFLPESAAVAFSPVADGGEVFAEFNIQVATFPFDSGGVVALDAASGATKWIHYFPRTLQTSPPRGILRVAVTGSLVIAPSGDGVVYALDRATGNVVWQAPSVGVYRPVAATSANVLVASNTGLVVALDAASGTERWRWTSGGSADWLVADDRTVYGHFYDGTITTLDAATGAVLWRVGLGATSTTTEILSAPAVDSDRVYAGANDGFWAFRK